MPVPDLVDPFEEDSMGQRLARRAREERELMNIEERIAVVMVWGFGLFIPATLLGLAILIATN